MNIRNQSSFWLVFCLVFIEMPAIVPWMLSAVSAGRVAYADESMDSGINKRGKWRRISLNGSCILDAYGVHMRMYVYAARDVCVIYTYTTVCV